MDLTEIVAIIVVIGLPVTLPFALAFYKQRIKAQEIALEQMKLQMEHSVRQDELNARILRMDDAGLSPTELASLAQEVRQLRQEVAQLRNQVNNDILG